jgi:outer membrane protein
VHPESTSLSIGLATRAHALHSGWLRRVVIGAALGIGCPALSAQPTDLMAVYGRALASDPVFQAAAAANRAAQENTPQARANLLPNVSGGGNTLGNEREVRQSNVLTGGTGRRNFNSHELNLRLNQPLYRKDRWIALDQAKISVDQADATFAFERQSLMLRAASRYFDVLRAADTLTFAVAEQEAFGQQLEQSQQRFDVGLVAVTDVEEAKAGFDLARAQVILAENGLDNAREALREVTGEYHRDVTALGESMALEMPLPNDIDRWTETALQQNLLLVGQRYAAQSSRLQIQREEAGHLPTVDIVGTWERSFANGGFTGGSDVTSKTIGLEVIVPLYSGGSVVSRTRQSRHVYQQSLDNLERVRRAVQRQTREAFLGVRSGISRVQALEQAVRSNEAAVEAIEAGFQVGTRTTVDVLNAQRDLFEAMRDFSDSRYAYIIDSLTLKQAAGTLEEGDLQLVNSWLR